MSRSIPALNRESCARRRVRLAGAVIALALPVAAAALDCGRCRQQRTAAEQARIELERNDALLGRNREYLTYLDPSEASKFIKIDSNIKMILVKRDRLKRELASVEGEIGQQRCEECQP